MSDEQLTIENAVRQAPNPRVAAAIENAAARSAQQHDSKSTIGNRLSPSERQALQAFAQGARAGISVQQQEAKHGGRAAIERKERAFAGVRSQNQHSGSK